MVHVFLNSDINSFAWRFRLSRSESQDQDHCRVPLRSLDTDNDDNSGRSSSPCSHSSIAGDTVDSPQRARTAELLALCSWGYWHW